MKTLTEKTKPVGNLAAILALTLALGGCISGGKPFAYTELHEIPPGPGLLSGEEGGYSIQLGGNRNRVQPAKPAQTAEIAQPTRSQQATYKPVSQPAAPIAPVRHGRMVEAVTQQ